MTDLIPSVPTIDTPTPDDATIATTVRGLYLNANNDILALIAGAMNLYAEAKGRLTGKHRFTPEDARRILDLTMILLDVPNVAQDFTGAKPAIVKEMKAREGGRQ